MSDLDSHDVGRATLGKLAYAEIQRWRQNAKEYPPGWSIDIQPLSAPLYRATAHLDDTGFWVTLEGLEEGQWITHAKRLQMDMVVFWAGEAAKKRLELTE